MPINYYTDDCTFTYRGKIKTSKWIRETAQSEGWKCGAVSIVFCSDARILEINNKYLNHNYLTDIITFDYDNSDEKTISGDLMIGIDTVRDNAEQFGGGGNGDLALRVQWIRAIDQDVGSFVRSGHSNHAGSR